MKKGFTLIELLSVIVVIAIISLIAIPSLTKVVSNIRLKADLESVRGYINAAENYYMKAEFNQDIYDTLGSNVIDKLDIKGTKLEGSVVVTHDGKIEVSIVKGNKCYKKSAVDDNNKIDVIDKSLCNTDTKGYVSNNGQLHVCGRLICNSRGNVVRLTGASAGLIGGKDQYDPPMRGELNVTSLHTLKTWGANLFRVFGSATGYNTHYIGEEDKYINALKKLIDAAIANDLYVLVNWDPAETNGDPMTDKAIEYFTRIANLYPNDPHIIYEIWNEPESNNTWDDVKLHASKVIPTIRSISPNAIVIVASPDYGTTLSYPRTDPLNYQNIMYTHHTYMTHINGKYGYKDLIGYYKEAIDANVPIFETEWGTMGFNTDDPMVIEPYASMYQAFLDKYKISYAMFGFNTSIDVNSSIFGIVKRGNWQDDLPDSILKPNGIFMKNALSGKIKSTANVLISNIASAKEEGNNYRSSEWKDKITSIVFKTTKEKPNNTVKSWDLSYSHDESVMGYLVPTTETDRYKLIISANGKIYAPTVSRYLFGNMKNLKTIDFTNFDTSYVTDINGMFVYDESLESLDLTGFYTKKIKQMWNTFAGCKNLKTLNLKGWKPNITDWGYTFNTCQSLTEIDLSGFNVKNAKGFSGMFYGCKSLKKIDISTWNPDSITNLNRFLINTTSLEEIDMSNMSNITDTADIEYALKGIKPNVKIIVKNQAVIDRLSPTATNTVNFEIKK